MTKKKYVYERHELEGGTATERREVAISREMSLLWFCKRDTEIELERAEWWARKACGTRDHDQALEAAAGAARCQWRCNNLLGAARLGYDNVKKLIGELALGEEAKLVLQHARDLGELIRIKTDRAQLEAQRAQDASRALAPKIGEVRT